MISSLPKWVEAGAFVLALVAGCVNAIGLLGFEHQSVSHLSGTATLIGSGVMDNSLSTTLHLSGVLLSFFAGGAIIRTTHVTGIFTDLGIMLGSALRGQPLDKRKAQLFLLIIAGFILGGTVGALLYPTWQFGSLLVPAACCLIIAAGYKVYAKSHTQ